MASLASGTAHSVPKDMKALIARNPALHAAWNDITPLARNEWICWITSAKLLETRERRLVRAEEELLNGKRRPCCWAGCPHR